MNDVKYVIRGEVWRILSLSWVYIDFFVTRTRLLNYV